MSKLEILKEWYYKEEDRKAAVENSINLAIGILTGIIISLYFLTTNYNFEVKSFDKYIFLICIGITVLLWIFTVINLFIAYNRFHRGYVYKGFSDEEFICDIYKQAEEYFEQNKEILLRLNTSLEDVKDNLFIKLIKQCIKVNVSINDTRFRYIHKSKIGLIYSLLSLFLACSFFLYNFITIPKGNIQKIYIMTDEAPPLPDPRPPRNIRENYNPSKSQQTNKSDGEKRSNDTPAPKPKK